MSIKNMRAFLDLAHSGRNQWWRYVLAVVLILFFWQILGALPAVTVMILSILREGLPVDLSAGTVPGMDTLAGFIALLTASVFFLCGIFLAVRFIHRRPLRTLISPAPMLAWGRILQGFAAWFVLAALMSVLEALLFPGRYVWTLDVHRFIPYVIAALVLIPIQTSVEELFFRGYLMQAFGLRVHSMLILCVISGLLFGLPHLLNPEASVNYPLMFLYYFAFGFSLAYITLRDGRLELALGAHAANNLFSVIFVNYTQTVLPSPSLFTVTVLDAGFSVPASLIGMAIFIILFTLVWWRKDAAPG